MGQRMNRVVDLPGGRCADLVVDRHDEGEGLGVILDDEDRPRRLIEALDDAAQVDEGVWRCMAVRSPTLSRWFGSVPR